MSNFIPETTAGYKVFYGASAASTDLLGIADVTLSELTPLSTSLKGPGIIGEINVPIMGQVGSMTMSMNFRTINKDLSVFAMPQPHPIDLRAGVQQIDAATGERTIQKVRIIAMGSTKKVALGKFAMGEGNGSSVELEITRFTMMLDDVPNIVIDKLNNIYTVNGVDMLGGLNEALGI
ncbi:MAG: hypothetical protein GY714_04920 [Desulfobacterales bacterium]|nr:hypothetical protein [Desulfobacterales bacterium]MCP4163620.1 hypothetical protein [Deltaproteobacteria bacterium]